MADFRGMGTLPPMGHGLSGGFLEYPIRGDRFAHRVAVQEHVASFTSPFQTIDLVRSDAFGQMLLLDGHIQLTELDEGLYHAGLVNVPLANLAAPRRALVIGGGDGGAIRQLMTDISLEQVEMVEIDEGVINVTKENWPALAGNAWDDPRLHLTIGDAFPYVKETQNQYDLVVVDSTDTYEDEEGELSEALFTAAFYRDLARILNPGGLVVTQSDNALFCPYGRENTVAQLGEVFPVVQTYHLAIPSFGGPSAYVVASHGVRLANRAEDVRRPDQLAQAGIASAIYDAAFAELPYRQLAGNVQVPTA